MDVEETKKQLRQLAMSMPNPYVRNRWYPAKLPNGNPVEICKKSENCIWLRKMTNFVLKSPTGEILFTWMDWQYFRGNLNTGKFVEVR